MTGPLRSGAPARTAERVAPWGWRARRLAASAVVLLAAACVEVDGAPERAQVAGDTSRAGVDMRLEGPGEAALVVPVHLNGSGPHDFVLDTGATLTCLDKALADSLGLPEARGQTGVGAGVSGGPGVMRLVEIDSIAIGGARAEGLTGCVLDLQQLRAMGLDAHGLVGLNFLTSFRVTLDFEDGRLTLEER